MSAQSLGSSYWGLNVCWPQHVHWGPHEYHSLVVNRIYHEDMLFAQRAYVLLAVQAFLMAGFTVLVSSEQGKGWPWATVLGAFGALLGIFQAAYGRQINRAIKFWRAYAHLIESRSGIPFDHLQYDFYAKAEVKTPFGNIEREDPSQRPLYSIFRRTMFLTSMVSTLGTVFSCSPSFFLVICCRIRPVGTERPLGTWLVSWACSVCI